MLNSNGKLINPEVRIENTNACNARCIICPRDRMTRPVATMCYGLFCSLVDQAVDLGAKSISVFGFGEPTVDSGLAEKIAYCSDRRLETFITTNGSLLGMNMASDLIGAGLKHIRFSFHSVAPLQHEAIHRGLSWLRVTKNFANFIDLNESRGHPCTVHISCIPMHGQSVDEIRNTWERYSDYLEVWRPHNWGGMKPYRKLERKKKTCGRPFNGPVQIQADGTIIPCCFLTNSEIVLGDTTEHTIETILNNYEYSKLREAHTTGNLEGYACEHCDQLNEELVSPLLYSNRDPDCEIGKTSTCKINVKA